MQSRPRTFKRAASGLIGNDFCSDMRVPAWTLEEPGPVETGPLRLSDIDLPEPGEGEVCVQVRACGICRTDLHVVEGDLPVRRRPVVPGHQIVGEVCALGPGVERDLLGRRVGIAWLHRTCGSCRFCHTDRENLCEQPEFTGWTVDGGYAQRARAPAAFVHALPDDIGDLQAAPLLCAGIIGYRSLCKTGIYPGSCAGARLGIYGFGAAGHVVIQLARSRGAEVYVSTRDRERHQALAVELGAAWVGDSFDPPPVPLDAAIVFAPAGELVPPALRALDAGGRLVLAGIHMSAIPSLDYASLYRERSLCTVANNTRQDAREFLREAARVPVVTHVEEFPFEQAGEALCALKHDAVRGAAVLRVSDGRSA